MTFIKIPLKGVNAELRLEIESKLPEPLTIPGWKFNGYRWRMLTQINTKDKNGNTDNSVRISGTGDNEILQNSLRKGIDVSKLTASIFPNDNLINGFNRVKNLKEIGYTEWIFAEYVPDESTLDDFRCTANKGDGQKVILDSEVEEIGRKRFLNRKDRSKQSISNWIRTLDLNWSGQKVDAVSNKINRNFERKGVIESYNREEAIKEISNLGLGADVLNTKDCTRVLRHYPQIMKNFVANGTTFNFALFDSDACSHEEIDNRREDSINELLEMDKIIMEYAAKRMLNMGIKPWDILGAIAQKIGADEVDDNGLVPIEI